jgi:hypothetical protein
VRAEDAWVDRPMGGWSDKWDTGSVTLGADSRFQTMRGAAHSRSQEVSKRSHLAKPSGDATHAKPKLPNELSWRRVAPNPMKMAIYGCLAAFNGPNFHNNPSSQTSGRRTSAKPQLPNEPTGPNLRASKLGQTTITKRTHGVKPPGDNSRPNHTYQTNPPALPTRQQPRPNPNYQTNPPGQTIRRRVSAQPNYQTNPPGDTTYS